MKTASLARVSILLIAFVTSAYADSAGTLITPRRNSGAALLANGKVLVAGGANQGSLASAELYDPSTGAWSPTGSLLSERESPAVTMLANGRVLVIGGFHGGPLASAELYDPATGAWSPTGSLNSPRFGHSATLLPGGRVLVAGGFDGSTAVASAELYDPATGTWSATNALATARNGHTATLLSNGTVLIAGGADSNGFPVASAELYDPVTDSWSTTGTLATARRDHTATLLANGQVLVAGGYGGTQANAEIYDPVLGTWHNTGALATGRYLHTATLLPSGKVLVAGGTKDGTGPLISAELFDPSADTWTAAPALAAERTRHTATLLADGSVLIAGGLNESTGLLPDAERFHLAMGSWYATAALGSARHFHSATLLPAGKVLVAGGYNSQDGFLSSTELYDPATGVWSPTSAMANTRYRHTATLLTNGKVLVVGGYGGSNPLNSCELYDPVSGVWTATGSLANPRYIHTATLLPDGRVLVTGGAGESGDLTSAELYDPATGTWRATGGLADQRHGHSATLLPNGKVLVVGGPPPLNVAFLATCELYDPVSGAWSAAAPLINARYLHTATLLPNGKVLVAAGYGGSFTSLDSAELYDPVADQWSVTGSLANVRHHHTATVLSNGRVLISGGLAAGETLAGAELYHPDTGTWSATGALADKRATHSATLLPNGQVLAVGGDGDGFLSSAELYDEGRGFAQPWQPQVTSAWFDAMDRLVVKGSGFRGLSSASGGNGPQDSPSNHPLVQWRRLDNEQCAFLPADAGNPFSDTAFTSSRVLPFSGYALITVFTHGIPSAGRIVAFNQTRKVRVGDALNLDLSWVDLEPGQVLKVLGLPPGLQFNAGPPPSITGTVLGLGTAGGVRLQIIEGRKVVRSIPYDLAVDPYLFAGSFEVLLEEAGKPTGKLKVIVSGPTPRTPNPAYSATLLRLGEPQRRAKGSFTAGGSPQSIQVAFPVFKTFPAVSYDVILTHGSDLVTATTTPPSSVTGRGFRLARPGRIPGGNPALTLTLPPVLAGDRTGTPGGIGYAKGSVNSKALVPLAGMLGDAQTFTTSLNLSQTNQAVVWLTPYKNKQSFLGGIITLGDLGVPGRGAPTQAAVDGLQWERALDSTAPSYPNGFAALALTASASRWMPTSTAEALALSLGLDFRFINVGYLAPTADVLPTRWSLRDNFALIPMAPAESVAFTGKASSKPGTFVGTLTLSAPATKSAVSGVFLQDAAFGALIGQGLVKIPVTGAVKGSFQTMGIELEQ